MEQPAPIVGHIKLIFHPFLTHEVIYFSLLSQSCYELSWVFFLFVSVYLFESEIKTGVSGPIRFINRID